MRLSVVNNLSTVIHFISFLFSQFVSTAVWYEEKWRWRQTRALYSQWQQFWGLPTSLFRKQIGNCRSGRKEGPCPRNQKKLGRTQHLHLLALNNHYLLKKKTSHHLFMKVGQGIVQVDQHRRFYWTVYKFCCSQIHVMGGLCLQKCYWFSRVQNLSFLAFREILKTQMNGASPESKWNKGDLMTAGLKREYINGEKWWNRRWQMMYKEDAFEILCTQTLMVGDEGVAFCCCKS